MTDETDLLAHEVECHQFTDPLPLLPKPSLARRAIARASGRVWFRVGWTCPHLKAVLESAEAEMLLKGHLSDHLDIYQLQGGASASAGTHSQPGAADLGQTSDAQIDILRLNGGDFQKRTPAQGFILHAHGFAQGCNCGSSALLYQKRMWNRRIDGLVSMGRVAGRWPTKKWSSAVAGRKKVIVALADDIANKTASKVLAGIKVPSVRDILGWAGINTSPPGKKASYWAAGHILSWLFRATKDVEARTAARIDALDSKIDATDAKLDLILDTLKGQQP